MADVYGLIDIDNDQTLYSLNGELEEFWDVVYLEITKIEDGNVVNEAVEWFQDAEEKMEHADFHELQKFVWEGKVRFNLDVENIQSQFYKKRNRCAQFCCFAKQFRKV